MLIFSLFLSLLFIIVSTVRFNLHPFLALVAAAIGFGLLSGMEWSLILQCINEGFGGLMGKIGLIIVLGVIIGTFLEKSGGAMSLAKAVLNFIGERFIHLALMITGFIVSIPVFADSGFVIMSPLNKALARKAAVPLAGTTAALAIGLTASHVLVPPTPGPVAAAGIIGANLGMVILWGLIVSVLALGICFLFVKYYASKIQMEQPNEAVLIELPKHNQVPASKAFLPIVIPIIFILLKSVANYPSQPLGDGAMIDVIGFVGEPVIALLIGLFIAFTLPKPFDRKMLSSTGWIGEGLKTAAPILLITGAGGIFGKMLQSSELAELISNQLSGSNLGLLVPFLLAAALKTFQGSSTVALVTTAPIMLPLLEPLGLDSEIMKVFTVLAIAAGSAVVSHVNDSFFWVVTQMTGFNVKEGYQVQTLGTLVLGVSAMLVVFVFSLFV